MKQFCAIRIRSIVALVLLSCLATAPPAHGALFMSEAQEKELGKAEHPKILEQFGGVYSDAGLSNYIAGIGAKIAANSNNPKLGYTITLLNSPIVNAFALPGGYVYVTRGLIGLANSEAEVAGVIGHEVGHVTARHTAKRYDRAVGTTLLGAIAGAVVGSAIVSDLFNLGGQLYLSGFSRQQEYEADLLGVRSIAKAGYDPYAQGDFLANMGRQESLEAKIGGDQQKRVQFFATHPNTEERVDRAVQEAAKSGVTVQGRPRKRDEFLNKINGMLYGDDPKEGFVRGQTFSHPIEKFTFTVPQGFRLQNTSQAVVAVAQDGSGIQFDIGQTDKPVDPAQYVPVFAQAVGVEASGIQSFAVNGLRAASGTTTAASGGQTVDVRFVAIEKAPGQLYRFLILTPRAATQSRDAGMRQTVASFRRLSDSEAAALKALRVRVVAAASSDTAANLSNRMAFGEYREERFRVVNGMKANDKVVAGQRYKIITE